MSEQPPTEGDAEFEDEVEQRMAGKQDAGPDDDPTDVAQEDYKSDVPTLEEEEQSPVDPGSV